MDKTWFEMKDVRKRRLSEAVWVPLRASNPIQRQGSYGHIGYKEEFFGLGSLAIPTDNLDDAKQLGWSDIGVSHEQRVWASSEGYKPAEIYQYNTGVNLGVELALAQTFTDENPEWHLNQDIVFALNLLREGDRWVRPDEGYVEVARLTRSSELRPIALEIKNEFLRDYLCARNMHLKLSWFHSRDAIVANVKEVGAPEKIVENVEGSLFELRVFEVAEGGMGGSFSAMRVSRNDVDPDEDVPRPGPQDDSNVTTSFRRGVRGGRPLVRVIGELWKEEMIRPAQHSARVRRDKVPIGLQYIVDASGETLTSEQMQNEDEMRWLWFRADVIPAFIKNRGGELQWYTDETGGASCSPKEFIHFGVNQVGLVTAYAYDIATLPAWQQRIWAGYNAAPEGGVSKELISAQARAIVAETSAPESALAEVIPALDELFTRRLGSPLFRAHSSSDDLISGIHRFRALENGGVFSLAKDLMRVIADRIDISPLQAMAPPPKNEKWGSLKSLEKYLATLIESGKSRRVMGPLVGVYQLRVADAHLPREDLQEAYSLAGIDSKDPPLKQGYDLIANVVSALGGVGDIVFAAGPTLASG
ncbi:hypothetical protein G6L16_026000 (plasmid) [Agrobacterium tumefaciens]|uniref:hypothetical protein n=1 Tax=Agrobacterium tumefaciens TaxID=358 RepID=UPI00157272AF|nr:hypothetical protein [Agrobacterium tumefaciens]NSZ66424.1 hypothetical protein [Agrobacterium tumefaciens]NTA72796.1 hypothetical protein [Agrobacterium tumefaciens]WIE41349.1 hypothetical protein G6L16_026000 [Agrobacterium tumefaciens]